ncbi:MAG: hypothetical protein KDM81_19390, partial [Verrucomicrobiae bacterium]|nr:hypothetical protein [Verrucomicrobiae bacterium]
MNGNAASASKAAGRQSALARFFRPSSPDPLSEEWRLNSFERDILLTAKGVILLILCYYLFLTNWMEDPPIVHQKVFGETAWRLAQRVVQYSFILYTAVTVATAFLLFGMQQVPAAVLRWILMLTATVYAAFLGGLVLVTGGIQSALYWLFPLLIARIAISFPGGASQLLLNALTCAAYAASVIGEKLIVLADMEIEDPAALAGVQLGAAFYLRLLLLITVAVWLLGLRFLLTRQRQEEEEQAEMMLRSEQLHATGRLAAEIAHKLKNPLAIINNASYTLQRTVKEGKGTITQQIQIIREEVERSDRLITELMGFSQLAEGRVERLDIKEEIERIIRQVFPPAVRFEVQIHRDYGPGVP